VIDDAVSLLRLLVAGMSLCALLGIAARTGPPPCVARAVAGGFVPLSLVAIAVPLLVGVVPQRIRRLLTAEAAADGAHEEPRQAAR